MRTNLPPNAVRIEDAPCGCERYAFDSQDAEGRVTPGGGTVALHTCEPVKAEPPKPARRKKS